MKKIIVLICLMFVLISCEVNKTVENKELINNTTQFKIEKQIDEEKEVKNKENLNNYTQSNEESEYDRIKNQITIKDLGSGFILKQTLDSTTLNYNGKKNYLWSHISEKNPFLWDDACDFLFKKFEKNGKASQGIWESLGKNEQKECLKESYNNSLTISKINSEFYSINKSTYGGIIKILFDAINNKIYELPVDFFEKVEKGKSGIYILYKGGRGCSGGLILINDKGEDKNLFKNNCDVDLNNIPKDYQEIIDFELMINKQVKIFYKGQSGDKIEKIINL